MKSSVQTLITLCFLLAAFSTTFVEAQVSEKESLRGLEGILVVVEDLHADAQQIDLRRDALVEVIETRLEDSGIKVLSIRERLRQKRKPYLYVNANIIFVPDIELVSFSIDVEAHQIVDLKNGDEAVALTWAQSYLGVQSKEKAAQKILDATGGLVDQFVSDFLDANDTPARSTREEI